MRSKSQWCSWSILILTAGALYPLTASHSSTVFAKEEKDTKPTPQEPEEVLTSFLNAMLDRDEKKIRQIIIEHPDAHVLWEGESLPALQKGIAKATFASQKFQRLKVGDEVNIPGRGKVVLGKADIDEDHLQLTYPGNPALPFLLVKQSDSWKVNAAPIIAARLVVARMKNKSQNVKRASWAADAMLLEKLAEETQAEGFSIRPPLKYKHTVQDLGAQNSKIHIWTGPPRADETYPMIVVLQAPLDSKQLAQNTNSGLLKGVLTGIKPSRDQWKEVPVEEGRIGSVDFTRARWSGICKTGRKQLVGKQMHGVVYLAKLSDRVLYVMIEDTAPDHETTVPICEAAVWTLNPANETVRKKDNKPGE